MSKIKVSAVFNANVYADGNNWGGRAKEVTLPEVTAKMVDHEALGLHGTPELPSGLDKLEAKFTWSSILPEVLRATNNPYRAMRLQVRASVEEYGTEGRTSAVPLVAHLTGTWKKSSNGTLKRGEAATSETEFAVSYYRLEIDGEVVTEVDVLNNIWRVDGEDLLADMRAHLGL